MSLKTYNPKRVSIRWKGIELNSDNPDGVFVDVAKDADGWVPGNGNDGAESRIKQNRTGAVITITVNRSSDVNRKLLAIAQRDKISETEIGAMVCSDPSSTPASGFLAADAYILQIPNFQRDNSAIGTVAWRFRSPDVEEADLGVGVVVTGA